ncbi:flagellar motor switch protein FliM [Nitrosospira multiformis]|jgi:flagellar motor switch protein FliM|uniref:Flagellar motor switch protein FliM n=1 Tax=Nitrosospira multiformis TaxID=1231 RepID=A0A1I7IHU9_9PROT|nr:flagellar motor switch protein FliM [Nitrosospira multiformis]SFU72514.1 flagellar motor switch protein FliM [Nitrosospira multiformis]
MRDDFLSREEVDALLRGVSSGSTAIEQSTANPGFRPYNLATQERIVRGRMPTLEIINERFARLLRLGLFNFMRRSANVTAGPVRVIKFSEFVRNLAAPSNLNLVHIKPLRGTSLFVFDPTLVFLVVDNLFGGDGRFLPKTEGRDFTQTEQRIIQRLLNLVFDSYGKSWQPVYPIEFEYLRAETNTQFANVATPNEVVIATTFEVNFGSVVGEMHICMPYSTLEPIRDLLSSALQGEALEVDKRWVGRLSKQVQSAEVTLLANLTHAQVRLDQILNMKVGDVIPLDIPEFVTASVDGVPVMECRYGISNGRYALRMEKMLASGSSE